MLWSGLLLLIVAVQVLYPDKGVNSQRQRRELFTQNYSPTNEIIEQPFFSIPQSSIYSAGKTLMFDSSGH
jgi:hypothetical protein